ncbi:MAG: preprotein translocase subunit SecG [Aquificaceae bacterium]|nr:MAG: preprotein translocase subunit SecG [Aquificaceae bacterium]
MIYNVLLIVQIIVALSIIGLVLMQHGKGADAGAAFGGGASGTVFGSRGSGNFLSRATGILAAVFFANSLALAWLVSHRGDSALSAEKSVVPAEVIQKVKSAPKAEPAPSDVPTSVGKPKEATAEVKSSENKGDTPSDVPK